MVLIHQFPVPTEGIRSQTSNVEALVGDNSHGKGTLYVSEAIISWVNAVSGEGFTIPYKKMTLHAISRDPALHASHCLYIMVNGSLEDDEDSHEIEPPANDDNEETTEIRFVPDDSGVLDEVYKAVQECTLLHPDPSSDMSEEEEEDSTHEEFQGYAPVADVGGPGYGPVEVVHDDDFDYYQDQQRQIENLQAYLRSRLQLGHGAGIPLDAQAHPDADLVGSPNANGNQNGNTPPFDPDQFADAD